MVEVEGPAFVTEVKGPAFSVGEAEEEIEEDILRRARKAAGRGAASAGHKEPAVKGRENAVIRAQDARGGVATRKCASDCRRTGVLLNCVHYSNSLTQVFGGKFLSFWF